MPADTTVPLLQASDVVFSGTACTGGEAEALVTATGMRTELGRIAALSQRVGRDESPLEHQVKRVAWLIALVAVGAGIAFLPIGLAAGLTVAAATSFAIGLLVANVPEGLLPTITLALAVGVRDMARRGALVKRLSAVETLGSTTRDLHRQDRDPDPEPDAGHRHLDPGRRAGHRAEPASRPWPRRDRRSAASGQARLAQASPPPATTPTCTALAASPAGDPTEIALLELAAACGRWTSPWPAGRAAAAQLFRFDPRLKLMTTVDELDGGLVVDTKGAPEEVLGPGHRDPPRRGRNVPITEADRAEVARVMTATPAAGCGSSPLPAAPCQPARPSRPAREDAERDLCLLGLVAMLDPPRPEVPAAIERVHRAGIRDPRRHRRQRADRRRDRPPGRHRRAAGCGWSPGPSWTP